MGGPDGGSGRGEMEGFLKGRPEFDCGFFWGIKKRGTSFLGKGVESFFRGSENGL